MYQKNRKETRRKKYHEPRKVSTRRWRRISGDVVLASAASEISEGGYEEGRGGLSAVGEDVNMVVFGIFVSSPLLITSCAYWDVLWLFSIISSVVDPFLISTSGIGDALRGGTTSCVWNALTGREMEARRDARDFCGIRGEWCDATYMQWVRK